MAVNMKFLKEHLHFGDWSEYWYQGNMQIQSTWNCSVLISKMANMAAIKTNMVAIKTNMVAILKIFKQHLLPKWCRIELKIGEKHWATQD